MHRLFVFMALIPKLVIRNAAPSPDCLKLYDGEFLATKMSTRVDERSWGSEYTVHASQPEPNSRNQTKRW
ncbi:hypothetical protein RIF29_22917 [Crotalaria pallida]|uniref:Secreted protein n=1 Tax=Crotalaria pallida TaxID=3830 RepID=A0AAN9F547_CROPI